MGDSTLSGIWHELNPCIAPITWTESSWKVWVGFTRALFGAELDPWEAEEQLDVRELMRAMAWVFVAVEGCLVVFHVVSIG